ncbi:MAG: transglycosylase SLT domain-containing protein [Pyrinomonadaceae bacterium]
MNRLAALIAVVVLFVSSVAPFEQKVATSSIKDLVAKHDHTALIERLSALKLSDPKQFAQHDYDYLLARTAEVDGLTAAAMANYHSVAQRNSVLRDYATAHLARITRASGNLLLERIYLNELKMFTSDEDFRAGAEHRLARNAFESANYAEAIRLLNKSSNNSGKSSTANVLEARAQLGEAYRMAGDVEKAKQIFNELLDKMQNPSQPDDAALSAVKNLDAINGNDASLGEAGHWRRAQLYQFNRYFDEARFHFEAVFAANREGANAAESLFQIGRGFAQKENFVEALAWYERVIEQFPTSSISKDALLQAAAAYSRVGKTKEAITRYNNFIDKYPRDEKLDRAYLNIVDVLRDRGSDADALKWCSKTAELFKGKVPEALAVFAEARIYLSKEDWQKALAALDRLTTLADLGGPNVPGGTTKSEVAFLRGFVIERLRKFDEAVEAYLSIPDGRSEYYGWRASQRLTQLAKDDAAKPFIENKLATLVNGLQAKDAETRRVSAQSILRLADNHEIRERAINALRSELPKLPNYKRPMIEVASPIERSDAARRLAELGLRDEAFPNKAAADLVQIEAQWKKIPGDVPIDLIPREQLELLYPVPFTDELLRHSATRGVDPRFVLAIIRQESRFQHDARSAAAARGLMQFIHTTTERVSNELGRVVITDDEMNDPETSILFGSYYLENLFALFPEKHEAVAAAYNGGETNVKRWLARVNSSEPDRYLPEIMFGQSKDYAAKVMTNYRMYQYLYDERLALKPSPRSE